MRTFLSFVFVLFVGIQSFAQLDLKAKLPLDPKVIRGKLDNGLTYYIRQNNKPEKKVELRLVVKVGSIMEDDDQLGLAHMAEHMAFNGTKNFKKNDIVSYLQSIGVEFGNDLNAYTSFDETVYILPIPTDQPGNLEKGFQILEDWAHQVTYLDEDINNERAIILEESRLGKSGEERMFKKIYPSLFKGSKYADRLPIGKDSIIKNFQPDAIRRFYRDWYRPDLMSVIVVGDLSPDEALKFIQKHFSSLKSPASPRKREYAAVPAYDENKAMVVTDKEATGYEFSVQFPARAVRPVGTLEEYRMDLIKGLYVSMMNNRFRELTQKADPPFVYAAAGFDSYARFHESFSVSGSTGTQDVRKGMTAALAEVERVKRFGFIQSEFERAKKNVLSNYERMWNNRDKTESAVYASEYIRNFTEEESAPGMDAEFKYVQQLLPSINLDEVNALTDRYRNEQKRFSFIMGPEAGNDQSLPIPEAILALLDASTKDQSIKPYSENVVASSLLPTTPMAGKIVSSKKNTVLGTTEWVLSNGVKVTLKSTDFKNDQVLFSATRYGGISNYGVKDKYSAENASSLITSMGVGEFNPTDLRKALAGKIVSLNPVITPYTSGFNGSSSKKDVETLFQLLNLYVNHPRKDSALFRSVIQRGKSQVAMLGANPQFAFIDTLYKVLFNNNPLAPTAVPKMENYDKIDLDRAMEIYRERLGSVSGMHITIVGSVDELEISGLLEKYVAGLPAKGTAAYVDNKVRPVTGATQFQFIRGKEDKSLILGIITGEVPFSESLEQQLLALSDAMNIIITEEMREKIQGIYGGGTNVSLSKIPYGNFQLVLQLPCGPAKVDTLISAFNKELNLITEKGIDNSYVEKVKKAWIEKYKVDIKRNEYWLDALKKINAGTATVDRTVNAQKYYAALTADDIRKAAMLVKKANGKLMAIQMPELAAK